MKPMADGTFKVAGEHPKTYNLENDNGAKAVIDTETANCYSWVDADGVSVLEDVGCPHLFPDSNTLFDGHFVPEERAKKLSFDRMIFKCNPGGDLEGLEYRVDVTMRADCLEYDIVLINASDRPMEVSTGVEINISSAGRSAGYKVTKFTGYEDENCRTGPITLPVGKFKETAFYFKISK